MFDVNRPGALTDARVAYQALEFLRAHGLVDSFTVDNEGTEFRVCFSGNTYTMSDTVAKDVFTDAICDIVESVTEGPCDGEEFTLEVPGVRMERPVPYVPAHEDRTRLFRGAWTDPFGSGEDAPGGVRAACVPARD